MRRDYKISYPSGEPITQMTGAYNHRRPIQRFCSPYEVVIETIRIIIKVGFTTDFASIPFPFWRVMLPQDPKTGPGAVTHDYLISNALLPRALIDDIFLSGLRYMRVLPIQRAAMYTAVRCAGIVSPFDNIDITMKYRELSGINSRINAMPMFKTFEEFSAAAKQGLTKSWAQPA